MHLQVRRQQGRQKRWDQKDGRAHNVFGPGAMTINKQPGLGSLTGLETCRRRGAFTGQDYEGIWGKRNI